MMEIGNYYFIKERLGGYPLIISSPILTSSYTESFYRKIIQKYIPSKDYDLTFKIIDKNCLMVFIKSKKGGLGKSMTIPLNKTKWKVVKRRLDTMFDSEILECTICEDFHGKGRDGNKLVSCNNCGNHYCLYCYTDIMRMNQGLIVCPFCRDEFGNKFEGNQVEEMIQMTFEKAKCLGNMKSS